MDQESAGGIFQGASPKLTFMFGMIAGVMAGIGITLLIIIPRMFQAAQ